MLSLPAELTHQSAGACLKRLVTELGSEGGAGVVIDAKALNRFDSSALAVLLAVRRQCQATGKTFAVSDMPSRLRDLAGVYGVAELVPAQ